MAAANAYPGYRTARMHWLPPVPAHWNEQRAKTFFREVDERSKTGQEELLSVSHLTGVTPRSQKNVTMFKAASYVGSKLCRPGDIVINTLWAWMAALGASRHVGIVSPAYGVYRPHRAESFNPAYLDYLLRTRAYVAEYIGRSTGIRSSRLRLYPNQFLDIALLQPPRPEQDQIVAYLRAQDAHIARLIKAKRELIGLLNEQKLRIIDHAVTRGLDASVALKPSGIEWLGDVPKHWEVQRLKNIASVVLGKMLTTEAKNGDGEFKPYLRSTNVQWIKPDVRDVKEMWIANSEMAQLRVRKGDLLVSEGGEVGRACMWNDELPECYIQNSVHRVAAKPMMPPEFLFHQFFAYGKRGRFNAIVNRVSIAHLTREKLVTVPFTVPPVEEQKAICKWIADECQPLDDAIARAEEEIKLIREYRDRQIADVVTGQVDVRGWVPGPDDVVAEEDLAALGGDEEIDTDGEEDDGDD
ncbi:restriction endonuclease subunit S [Massilia putida]|uniref:restriction endonuclease subunit S n=1 Tax=Massilia putida TaxID=1141883 RepID=UPI0009525BD5|nr:restriction endonuclease subunit S [Massilia putida]